MELGRTILVIDDDAHVREALEMVLVDRGFRVITANDGEAGFVRALRDQPDLIICDMMMPRASGFVVVERIKSNPKWTVPFIMLTGNPSEHQRQYAELLGVDRYLSKPVGPFQLFEAVDQLLSPPTRLPSMTDPPSLGQVTSPR